MDMGFTLSDDKDENEKMFRMNPEEKTVLMSLYVIKACVQKHRKMPSLQGRTHSFHVSMPSTILNIEAILLCI